MFFPQENKSMIEELVAAAARSFSVATDYEFPGEPLGYTGETGTSTDAFKGLDAK